MATFTTTCERCGVDFEAVRASRRFCTNSHRAAAHLDGKLARLADENYRAGFTAAARASASVRPTV